MLEKILILRLRMGDNKAYHALIKKYHEGLFWYLYELCKDQDLAQDLTQETYVRVFEKIGGFKEKGSLKNWMYKIARNIFLNRIRKKNISLVEFDEMVLEVQDSDISPLLKTQTKEVNRNLRQIINSLKNNLKEVVVLHYLHGFSLREVSHILDIPVGTVKTRLNKALSLLRDSLTRKEVCYEANRA